ncbi:hypothetical protein BDL97_01G085000 [Sphagnum fallax]|nr:hypothetical protein BDL97_01G085000 [Sphagnum fallax]
MVLVRPLCACRGLFSRRILPFSSILTNYSSYRGLLFEFFGWRFGSNPLLPVVQAAVATRRSSASKAGRNAGQSGKRGDAVPPIAVVAAKSSAHFQRLMQEAKARTGGLAVVYFTSNFSDSCRLMSRAVNFLSTQYHDITFLRVDFDKAELQEAINAAGISDVPTFQFYKKGKVTAQMTGADPTKLKEMVAGSQYYAKYRKK